MMIREMQNIREGKYQWSCFQQDLNVISQISLCLSIVLVVAYMKESGCFCKTRENFNFSEK